MAVDQVSARSFSILTSTAQHDAAGPREGTLIEGRVVAINPDETLRVATRYGILDVEASRVYLIGLGRGKVPPLSELIGSTVRLEVTSGGHSAGRLQVRLIGGGDTPQSTSLESEIAHSETAVAARISAEVSQAAARQDGLAPVFAVAGLLAATASDLPVTLAQALADLVSHGLDGSGNVSAGAINQAVSSSGLFLEAKLSQAVSGAPSGGVSGFDPAKTIASQDLKAALLRLRSALDGWIAETDVAAENAGARTASGQMDGPVSATISAPIVTTSSRPANPSPAFDAEALFAVLRPPPVASTPGPVSSQPGAGPVAQFGGEQQPGANVLADLVTMATLGEWFQASGQTLPGGGLRRNAYGKKSPLDETSRSASALSDQPATSRPPPPRRGSLPIGQSAQISTGHANRAPIDLAQELAILTSNALARVSLGQYASLSESLRTMLNGGSARLSMGDAPLSKVGASWLFEIPIRIGGSTSIAQFEIDQVLDGGSQPSASPAWRVQFSLDVAQVGPVHARLLLADQRLSVGLWVENTIVATMLQQALPRLRRSLEAAHFVVDEIHFAFGRPPSGPPVRAGGFVDRNA